jgi:deoxyribose-phosphate aldolase
MKRPDISMTRGQVARLIDHTLLRPDATLAQIEALCREATACGFATACVNPTWVQTAARLVSGGPVGVCTVVAFPFGATTTEVKVYEARRAIAAGALEIDAVINIGALKSGQLAAVRIDVEDVVAACHDGGALCKVIIEAALLTDDEKAAACAVAEAAGADFVKTSTGFGGGGATTADVALIRRLVGPKMGIKAAGGIRDLETVETMIAAGATRIGTSAGVKIVEEASRREGQEGQEGR